MASRALKPDPPRNPNSLGKQMRQGDDPVMPLPHGLASSMKQGSVAPNGESSASQLGSRMKQGK